MSDDRIPMGHVGNIPYYSLEEFLEAVTKSVGVEKPNPEILRQAEIDKAIATIKKARKGWEDAKERRLIEEQSVIIWEQVLGQANLALDRLAPKARGVPITVPLPGYNTWGDKVLRFCKEPTKAETLCQEFGVSLARMNVIVSGLVRDNHMTRPARAYYQTRFPVLVELGLAHFEDDPARRGF